MSRVLCFGELLLRLSPKLNGEWLRQHAMPVFVGGAELNVATALARWGVPVDYCTVLPDHYLSHEIVASIKDKNIHTDKITYSGERIGSYYLPQGADLKNAGVFYDRTHSSFWELKPGSIDWNSVLDGVDRFHFSAISPALNADVAAVCHEGAEAASKKGLTVSIDLNYRSKLWQYGKEPHEVMPELVQWCDLVMGNLWAAEKMLGVSVPSGLANEKEAFLEQSERSSEAIRRVFPRCRQVANTFRFDDGAGVRYYATLYDGQLHTSAEYHAGQIIDKVGSGDTFMAGFIYGNHHRLTAQQIIDFAAAAAFHKLFIKGDATTASVEDIRKDYLSHA